MTVGEIMTAYGPSYLETYKENIPRQHYKVIRDIIYCRTPAMGTVLCGCTECGNTYEISCSCGNRHCPTCQGDKAHTWLEKRLDSMLPVNHFMITFTVPSEFRDVFRKNQRILYSALFEATSKTMMQLASKDTYFPGDLPGFFGVLHTSGRTMQYHPHIHYIVPGGAFDSSYHSWHNANPAFFLPIRVMAKLVKQKMFRVMRRENLLSSVLASAWHKSWNVNSQPVGSGERSVRYLGAYIFRTAISDKRVLHVANEMVAFQYTDTKSGKDKIMRVSIYEFIRRFLQHVLPSGFMKIRYYGFMRPSSRIPLQLAVVLLEAFSTQYRPGKTTTKQSGPTSFVSYCIHCKGIISYLRFIPPIHSCSGFR